MTNRYAEFDSQRVAARPRQGLLRLGCFPDRRHTRLRREFVYGANMGFLPALFKVHRFDPRFGRDGNDAILVDQTDLQGTLSDEELKGIWVAKARIRHFVPGQRLAPNYV